MTPLRPPFESRLAHSWPPDQWRNMTVLVAVSGGADSVALLCGLAAWRGGTGRLAAAHFNHGLRPEAGADQKFVAELCHRLEVSCELGSADVASLARDQKDGLEAAARAARYDFLQQTAERTGARYVATAHTADDQAETVLHRILRGTGLAGLGGMRRARPLGPAVSLIRPLLAFRRQEVLDYLAQIGQPFRDDAMNQDTRFTRNRIRHQLLPLLKEDYGPAVVEALLRLSRQAAEAQEVLQDLADKLAQRCVSRDDKATVTIDLSSLRTANAPAHLVREMLRQLWREQAWPEQGMTGEHWDRLAELALSRDPAIAETRQTFPGAVSVRRSHVRMELTR